MSSVEPPPAPPIAEAADRSEKSPITLIVVNAALLLLIDTILIFVIPIFAEMFAGFGAKLPLPTRWLIDLSHFLRNTFLLANPLLIFTVAFGVFLSRDHPSRASLKWTLLIQSLILVAMILIMFQPIFLMAIVTGGQ